jgi:hypothetical protein
MILTDHEGNKYWAHFRHVTEYTRVTRTAAATHRTECHVHLGPCKSNTRPCGTPGMQGVAYCSTRDEFDKLTGHKLAFGRALAHYPRALRRDLWRSYLFQRRILTDTDARHASRSGVTLSAKELP